MSAIQSEQMLPNVRCTGAEDKKVQGAGSHYLRTLREDRADGNRTGMTRTEKKSLVLWLERQSERKEGGSWRKTRVYESELY